MRGNSWRQEDRPTPDTCPGTGGYLFAADPTLSALETTVAWRADVCSSVLSIAAAPAEFEDAITFDELLARATSSPTGAQLFLGQPGAGFQLNIMGDAEGGAALLLPLDADLPARLAVARQLWVWLCTRSSEPPDSLTAQQRTRLVEQLRALDGKLDGASIREIAAGLFGADRLPSGRDWRAHDLRNRTRRLIDRGLKLMRGGYRALLRRP